MSINVDTFLWTFAERFSSYAVLNTFPRIFLCCGNVAVNRRLRFILYKIFRNLQKCRSRARWSKFSSCFFHLFVVVSLVSSITYLLRIFCTRTKIVSEIIGFVLTSASVSQWQKYKWFRSKTFRRTWNFEKYKVEKIVCILTNSVYANTMGDKYLVRSGRFV